MAIVFEYGAHRVTYLTVVIDNEDDRCLWIIGRSN